MPIISEHNGEIPINSSGINFFGFLRLTLDTIPLDCLGDKFALISSLATSRASRKGQIVRVCGVCFPYRRGVLQVGTSNPHLPIRMTFHLRGIRSRVSHGFTARSAQENRAIRMNPYQKQVPPKAPAGLETRRHRFPSPAFRLLSSL